MERIDFNNFVAIDRSTSSPTNTTAPGSVGILVPEIIFSERFSQDIFCFFGFGGFYQRSQNGICPGWTPHLVLHRHTTLHQQFFAKKLCHMGRIIPSIRWFGWIWLSVQVWLRRILKKRDISTSSSENVSCFGSTADFNPEKSSTFGPRGIIDATSFQYDVFYSEPILSFSERNFQWRIFEVEK